MNEFTSCGVFVDYSEAFTDFFDSCTEECLMIQEEAGNPTTQTRIVHNPIYVLFVYLSIVLLIVSTVLFVRSRS